MRTNKVALLTLSALSWSSNMVLGRAIRGDIAPLTLSFWRWAIAGLLVPPLALPPGARRRQDARTGTRPRHA